MGRRSSIPSGDAFLPGTSAGELRAMSGREKDARDAKRYAAAYHRKMGRSVADVAEAVCEEYETVGLWLARCRREGVSGIPRRGSRGRSRLLSQGQRAEIVKDVRRGPRRAGYESDAWTYKDLWRHIREKYGVEMTYAAAVQNLHEMGVSPKVLRPQRRPARRAGRGAPGLGGRRCGLPGAASSRPPRARRASKSAAGRAGRPA